MKEHLIPCPGCGGREFTGVVSVEFYMVPVTIEEESPASREGAATYNVDSDWEDAPASGDRLLRATCIGCAREQVMA